MPVDHGEEKFGSGRAGNSRSRPGFMRPSARMLPLDFLTFFNLKNTDQGFALTVQRVKDILTGILGSHVSLRGGLSLDRHASNTPPVMRTFGSEVIPAGAAGEHPMLGVKWFVQPTNPALVPANSVQPGDLWVH